MTTWCFNVNDAMEFWRGYHNGLRWNPVRKTPTLEKHQNGKTVKSGYVYMQTRLCLESGLITVVLVFCMSIYIYIYTVYVISYIYIYTYIYIYYRYILITFQTNLAGTFKSHMVYLLPWGFKNLP